MNELFKHEFALNLNLSSPRDFHYKVVLGEMDSRLILELVSHLKTKLIKVDKAFLKETFKRGKVASDLTLEPAQFLMLTLLDFKFSHSRETKGYKFHAVSPDEVEYQLEEKRKFKGKDIRVGSPVELLYRVAGSDATRRGTLHSIHLWGLRLRHASGIRSYSGRAIRALKRTASVSAHVLIIDFNYLSFGTLVKISVPEVTS